MNPWKWYLKSVIEHSEELQELKAERDALQDKNKELGKALEILAELYTQVVDKYNKLATGTSLNLSEKTN